MKHIKLKTSILLSAALVATTQAVTVQAQENDTVNPENESSQADPNVGAFEEAQSNYEQAGENVAAASETVHEIENELEEVRTEKETLQSELTTAEQDLVELEAEAEQVLIEEENAKVQAQADLETAGENLEAAQARVDKLEADPTVSAALTELEEVNQAVSVREAEVSRINEAISEVDQDLESTNQSIASGVEAEEGLSQEHEVAEAALEESNTQAASLQESLEEAEATLNNYRASSEEGEDPLAQERSEARASVAEAELDVETAIESLTATEASRDQAQETYNTATADLQREQEAAQALEEEISAARAGSSGNQEALTRLEELLAQARESRDDAEIQYQVVLTTLRTDFGNSDQAIQELVEAIYEYELAENALEETRKEAQAQIDLGSLGFFESQLRYDPFGAQAAIDVFNSDFTNPAGSPARVVDHTDMGERGDATSLANMHSVLLFGNLSSINSIRAREDNRSISPLGVTHELMALAQVSTNWASDNEGQSGIGYTEMVEKGYYNSPTYQSYTYLGYIRDGYSHEYIVENHYDEVSNYLTAINPDFVATGYAFNNNGSWAEVRQLATLDQATGNVYSIRDYQDLFYEYYNPLNRVAISGTEEARARRDSAYNRLRDAIAEINRLNDNTLSDPLISSLTHAIMRKYGTESEVEDIETQLTELTRELAPDTEALQELETELTAIQGRIVTLEANQTEAANTLASANQAVEVAQANLEVAQNTLASRTAALEALLAEDPELALIGAVDEARTALEAAEAVREERAATLSQAATSLAEIQNTLVELRETAESLTSQRVVLSEELAEAQAALALAQEPLAELEASVADYLAAQNLVDQLEATIAELTEIIQSPSQAEAYQARISELEDHIGQLRNAIAALEVRENELVERLAQANLDLANALEAYNQAEEVYQRWLVYLGEDDPVKPSQEPGEVVQKPDATKVKPVKVVKGQETSKVRPEKATKVVKGQESPKVSAEKTVKDPVKVVKLADKSTQVKAPTKVVSTTEDPAKVASLPVQPTETVGQAKAHEQAAGEKLPDTATGSTAGLVAGLVSLVSGLGLSGIAKKRRRG